MAANITRNISALSAHPIFEKFDKPNTNMAANTTPNTSAHSVLVKLSTDKMAANNSAEILAALSRERLQELTPVIVYLSILIIIGITCNIVVLVIYGRRPVKTSSSYFILCLATFDLIGCTISIPFDIFDIVFIYNFEYPWVCKLFRFVSYFIIMLSITTLVIIAFDRYYKVCKPMRSYTKKRLQYLTVLDITLSLLFSWPAAIVFGDSQIYLMEHDVTTSQCSFDANINIICAKAYYGILGSIFLLCMGMLIVPYTQLWRQVRNHEKKMAQVSKAETVKKNTDRMSMIFFLISVVFFVSYSPTLIVLILRCLITDFENFDSYAADISYEIFLRFYFINNVANPIIYGFLNRDFRKECLELLKTVKKCICVCTCGHNTVGNMA